MSAMAREMAEQPEVIGALLDGRHELDARLRAIAPERLVGVLLIARGSSDNAAVYGRYVLEAALRRPVSLAAPSLWTRYVVGVTLVSPRGRSGSRPSASVVWRASCCARTMWTSGASASGTRDGTASVEVSSLGDAAVLTGALAFGLRAALDNVFTRRSRAVQT